MMSDTKLKCFSCGADFKKDDKFDMKQTMISDPVKKVIKRIPVDYHVCSECDSSQIYYWPSGESFNTELNKWVNSGTSVNWNDSPWPIEEIVEFEPEEQAEVDMMVEDESRDYLEPQVIICDDCGLPHPDDRDCDCTDEEGVYSSLPKMNTTTPMPEVRPPKNKVVPNEKYLKQIHPIVKHLETLDGSMSTTHHFVDIYRVLDAYSTGDAAIDHAVKKILCAGNRHDKDWYTDMEEAVWSLQLAIQLQREKDASL